MFNKNEFNAMLARHGMTKEELANILGMKRETLYRRIWKGWFYTNEVQKMIDVFGKDEVIKAIFNC